MWENDKKEIEKREEKKKKKKKRLSHFSIPIQNKQRKWGMSFPTSQFPPTSMHANTPKMENIFYGLYPSSEVY